MKIRLLSIGNKMPSWVTAGVTEYAKRFTGHYQFTLIEIPPEKRSKNSSIEKIIEIEGEKILAAIKPGHRVIALAIQGQPWSTTLLAENIKKWQQHGENIDLLIGGPEGLSDACLKRANEQWSLSALTFPHPLVRIIVAEQLYRAMSLIHHHPYHRD